MEYHTVVTWDPPLTEEQRIEVDQHGADMAAQGKTNDIRVYNPPLEQIEGSFTVTRTWATLQDAEEWVVYIEQFNPASVTIESVPIEPTNETP
jgi:hypothetical protein